MGKKRQAWTIHHFSLANRRGAGQGDVPALLRRAAKHLKALGDVQVEDITFGNEPTAGEDQLRITIYYHPEPRRR